jgi:hypothetical protein
MIQFDDDFPTTLDRIHAARDAFDAITRMTAKCDCSTAPPYRDCIHSDFSSALRDLLIDRDYDPTPYRTSPSNFDADDAIYTFIRHLLSLIDAAEYQTQRLSMLYLDHSLCPMHHIDYAACFDDDDAECATIRAYFPEHDT